MILRKHKNERLESIYMLVKGEALLEVYDVSGEMFMYIIPANQIFGMENLILNDDAYSKELEYKVTALSSCSYIKIDAQFFLDYAYINPSLYHCFFSDLITRYFFLAQSHQYINKNPSIKLGNALMNIALILKLKKNRQNEIIFPRYITQEFLSKYTRSSAPNISNASSDLEKMKIIKRNPFIIIDDEKLKKVIFNTIE